MQSFNDVFLSEFKCNIGINISKKHDVLKGKHSQSNMHVRLVMAAKTDDTSEPPYIVVIQSKINGGNEAGISQC